MPPIKFQVIAEHSVALSLLPEKANVLDLGCRNFLFTKAMRELGHHVWPVDMDHLNESQAYYQCAVSDFNGKVGVLRCSDPQATKMGNGSEQVPCYTLDSLTENFIKGKWDLIKMDIEGAEYEVIMSLTEPPAKQLSIEFHLHTGIYGQIEMRLMENTLHDLGYRAVSHEYTPQHGAGNNYWDSLFIL